MVRLTWSLSQLGKATLLYKRLSYVQLGPTALLYNAEPRPIRGRELRAKRAAATDQGPLASCSRSRTVVQHTGASWHYSGCSKTARVASMAAPRAEQTAAGPSRNGLRKTARNLPAN